MLHYLLFRCQTQLLHRSLPVIRRLRVMPSPHPYPIEIGVDIERMHYSSNGILTLTLRKLVSILLFQQHIDQFVILHVDL